MQWQWDSEHIQQSQTGGLYPEPAPAKLTSNSKVTCNTYGQLVTCSWIHVSEISCILSPIPRYGVKVTHDFTQKDDNFVSKNYESLPLISLNLNIALQTLCEFNVAPFKKYFHTEHLRQDKCSSLDFSWVC